MVNFRLWKVSCPNNVIFDLATILVEPCFWALLVEAKFIGGDIYVTLYFFLYLNISMHISHCIFLQRLTCYSFRND